MPEQRQCAVDAITLAFLTGFCMQARPSRFQAGADVKCWNADMPAQVPFAVAQVGKEERWRQGRPRSQAFKAR